LRFIVRPPHCFGPNPDVSIPFAPPTNRTRAFRTDPDAGVAIEFKPKARVSEIVLAGVEIVAAAVDANGFLNLTPSRFATIGIDD
jgi:hypothetical protein